MAFPGHEMVTEGYEERRWASPTNGSRCVSCLLTLGDTWPHQFYFSNLAFQACLDQVYHPSICLSLHLQITPILFGVGTHFLLLATTSILFPPQQSVFKGPLPQLHGSLGEWLREGCTLYKEGWSVHFPLGTIPVALSSSLAVSRTLLHLQGGGRMGTQAGSGFSSLLPGFYEKQFHNPKWWGGLPWTEGSRLKLRGETQIWLGRVGDVRGRGVWRNTFPGRLIRTGETLLVSSIVRSKDHSPRLLHHDFGFVFELWLIWLQTCHIFGGRAARWYSRGILEVLSIMDWMHPFQIPMVKTYPAMRWY